MSNLKRITLAISLAVVLAGTAFAGETQSPPCDPGETSGPPCPASRLIPEEEAVPNVPGEVEQFILEATYAIESVLLTVF